MKMTLDLFMHIEQFKDRTHKNKTKNDTHVHTGRINTELFPENEIGKAK